MKDSYIYYGTKTTPQEVEEFIEHMMDVNHALQQDNKPGTPLCVWGQHGIGKTQMIEAIARKKSYKFVSISPAQFEEMGDLLGMPKIIDDKTVFAAPSWVPDSEGPGILLIDDINRADDRILRGIMQLLQNYKLVSWKLPPDWHIIATANPDGGDYSVTPMDNAILTRMMHITLTFDHKEWALWAENQGIDSRGIDFVLTYPEIVDGERTTPRTLVQFFDSISKIRDLKADLPLVQLIADACLDASTTATFIAFVKDDLSELISIKDILDAKDFAKEVEKPLKKRVKKKSLRVDILATLCTRLLNYLVINNIKPDKNQLKNIKSFILLDFLPNDLRLITAQELVDSKNRHLKVIMKDKEIAFLLLAKM
ncbi:ATPase [hydrothermal vent metagenome]|uniref:ATPase n=1 Tax=hydrothermal vent metagenome TaxID=652676 RepID=A0A3B0X1P7_9ZZZZ